MEQQLACFNRSRLPAAPRSTDELLSLSARGVQVGLAIDPVSLHWTCGSLGASEALPTAAASTPLSIAQRQSVVDWMGWLPNASLQQRITFYSTQEQLVQELRQSLGSRLGVAELPDGPRHRAGPVNRLRVWSFGRNSCPRQRLTAEAFAAYSINPPVQRDITVGTQST
jgi:hypothetical protein